MTAAEAKTLQPGDLLITITKRARAHVRVVRVVWTRERHGAASVPVEVDVQFTQAGYRTRYRLDKLHRPTAQELLEGVCE